MQKISLRSPATVSNLSCGFDTLGICLNEPYDEIEIKKISTPVVVINSLKSPFSNIPINTKENTGGIPAELIINELSLDFGFEINIKKGIPLCGGLGSSAATAMGVVYGINEILERKISKNDMLKYALEGEKLSSESLHADNIAPCLMGGLVLVRDIKPIDLIQIPTGNYYFSIIHPDIKISTSEARSILPKKINLELATKQWANISALTYSFVSNDIELMKRSMIDYIVEPIRSKLIPKYNEIKKIALNSGAIGCSISGSGPSIFAISTNKEKAKKISDAMKVPLKKSSIRYHSYISSINQQGVKTIK